MVCPIRVVIPCHAASETIQSCLAALCKSNGVIFEIVLVDDGNNGELSSLVSEYPLTIVHTPGMQGAGSARNRGAEGFAGDILVFLDSDVMVEQDTICKLVKPILECMADATVGNYSTSITGKTVANAYKQLYLAYTYNSLDRELKNTFWTAIGAVKNKVFIDVGGFTTVYRGAGPEDVDLGIKLTRKNAKIIMVSDAVGNHLKMMYGLGGLISNDFRKGYEDIYIHFVNKVMLTDNRHANPRAIIAVALSWTTLGIGIGTISTSENISVLYLFALSIVLYIWQQSGMLVGGFLPAGIRMFLVGWPLTFLLDVVRGCSVIAGVSLVVGERLSGGAWKPLLHKGRSVL